MSTREATIEASVVRGAKALGVVVIKLAASKGGTTGWPDRLFVLPNGRTLWIELKRPGAEPTPLQLYRHQLLRSLGHRVEVHDTVGGALRALEQALRSKR